MRRAAKSNGGALRTRPAIERLFAQVRLAPETGCWEWQGYRDRGYGMMRRDDGTKTRAHRVAYELLVGPIPEGLHLDHLCRNPPCVNPAHLEPVTPQENVRRGRANKHLSERTHCPSGHPFDEANTRWKLARICKACHRKASRDHARRAAAKRQAQEVSA